METKDLFTALCTVRNSMMNILASNILFNTRYRIEHVLETVSLELAQYDTGNGIFDLSEDQLFDLGFEYLDKDERPLMLFPIWVVPFIPRGTNLVSVDGSQFIAGIDDFEIYNDHWVNFGFYP